MTKEKFSACNHPVLTTINKLFTAQQLAGTPMRITDFPSPLTQTVYPSIGSDGISTPNLPPRFVAAEVRGPRTANPNRKPEPQNQLFQTRMADVGYMRHQAWSTWFVETVYTNAWHSHPKLYAKFKTVFTGSTLDTFRRMCICHGFSFSETPQVGAIAFYQIGHTWLGQAGIVCKVSRRKHFFECIEAHNHTGEEDSFFLKVKTRKTKIPHQPHGLNLQGFIIPHPEYL